MTFYILIFSFYISIVSAPYSESPIMMRIILFLNTLVIAAVSLALIFAPNILFSGLDASVEVRDLGYALSRNNGFASLAIAALSGLMITRSRDAEAGHIGYGTLAVFHLGMTIAHVLNVFAGLVSMIVVGVHGVFALIFLVVFIWQWRK